MATDGFFATWARSIRLPWIGDYVAGLAAVGDRVREWMQTAVQMHLPSYATDADARALLASERGLEPTVGGVISTDLLLQWIQQWQLTGSSAALLAAVYYCGFGNVGDCVVIQQNGLATTLVAVPNLADVRASALSWVASATNTNANPPIPVSADGKPAIPALTVPWYPFALSQMDADGNQHNGRFVLLFPNGLTPGASLSVAENLAKLRRLIRAYRPASRFCYGIYQVTSGASLWDWPAGRLWDDGAGAWWDSSAVAVYAA